MNKKDFSERDICTKFITPALVAVGWTHNQFREEVKLTDGRVIVRGKLAYRLQNPAAKGGPKRADYVLYANASIPIAVIEAKRNIYEVGHGMQQALDYAEMLDVPIAISSNGDGFLLHDRSGITQPTERELSLEAFPAYDDLLGHLPAMEGHRVNTTAKTHRPALPHRRQRQGAPVLSEGSNQPYYRGHRQGPAAHPARHGHRHGKDLHRFSNNLAAVEGEKEKAHALPRRPQYTHRPDHPAGFRPIRRSHAQDQQPYGEKEL